MGERPDKKRVDWVGSSLDDLRSFPNAVQQSIGFEIYQVQLGGMPKSSKPLKGREVSGVYELRDNFRGDTYRAVYIAKLNDKIYVLHCFQKKSKRGIATAQKDMELIKNRLKQAIEYSKGGAK